MSLQHDTRILYIDYSKCIGCETCEAVCKFLYKQPRIIMVRTPGGEMAPLYCRHCPTPMCVKVCKPGALTVNEEGHVLLDSMRCRGCENMACVPACPFGGMYATGEGVGVAKCDLCAERRKHGMLPACMEMCPCGAIRYATREAIAQYPDDDAAKVSQKRVLSSLNPSR